MLHLAHIINPFHASQNSDLFTAQPITFESMIRARDKAKGQVEVELLSAQFHQDRDVAPIEFRRTEDLSRSVSDMANFKKPLHLPLLADILDRLYTESDAEYLIYSNVDIGLYPDFYLKVKEFIKQGHDAFIINRRRLDGSFKKITYLDFIYKETGKKHPGFDCFVFQRSLYPQFQLGNICIGVPFIEISFSQNLFALAHNFKLYDEEILTFHLGMEIFKKRAPKEYYDYNRKQFWNLVPKLLEKMDLKKFPYAHYLLPIRLIKWGLHPCIPIRLVAKLYARNLKTLFE